MATTYTIFGAGQWAFCTAESVLVDYYGMTTIADTTNYPLICACP